MNNRLPLIISFILPWLSSTSHAHAITDPHLHADSWAWYLLLVPVLLLLRHRVVRQLFKKGN